MKKFCSLVVLVVIGVSAQSAPVAEPEQRIISTTSPQPSPPLRGGEGEYLRPERLEMHNFASMTTRLADEEKPETLTGVVGKAPDVSFCMDGAAHVLLSSKNGRTNTTRLKAKTENVKKQLEQLLGANVT